LGQGIHHKGTARQSRNQNIFTEENEGNKDREKLCQKCRVFGHSTTEQLGFPASAVAEKLWPTRARGEGVESGLTENRSQSTPNISCPVFAPAVTL
jgi:hypothetical protein